MFEFLNLVLMMCQPNNPWGWGCRHCWCHWEIPMDANAMICSSGSPYLTMLPSGLHPSAMQLDTHATPLTSAALLFQVTWRAQLKLLPCRKATIRCIASLEAAQLLLGAQWPCLIDGRGSCRVTNVILGQWWQHWMVNNEIHLRQWQYLSMCLIFLSRLKFKLYGQGILDDWSLESLELRDYSCTVPM